MLSEKTIEAYLVKSVHKFGGECFKLYANVVKGMPDRLVCLPEGKVFFVEVKRENGKLSLHQLIIRDRIIKTGARHITVYSKKDIDETLQTETSPSRITRDSQEVT